MRRHFSIKELQEVFGMKYSTVYKLTRRPDFPPHIEFGGAHYWLCDDVEAFIAARAAAEPTRRRGTVTASGVVVYTPKREGGPWRARWEQEGKRYDCRAVSEQALAAKIRQIEDQLRRAREGSHTP